MMPWSPRSVPPEGVWNNSTMKRPSHDHDLPRTQPPSDIWRPRRRVKYIPGRSASAAYWFVMAVMVVRLVVTSWPTAIV